jgi:hypothetical protein
MFFFFFCHSADETQGFTHAFHAGAYHCTAPYCGQDLDESF